MKFLTFGKRHSFTWINQIPIKGLSIKLKMEYDGYRELGRLGNDTLIREFINSTSGFDQEISDV